MAENQPRTPPARQREMARDQKEKLAQANDERRAENEGGEKAKEEEKPQLADDKGATPREDKGDAMHGPNRREARGTTREEDLAAHEAKVAGMRSSVKSEQDLPVSSRSDEALVEAWQHFHARGNTTLVPESPEAIEIANIHNELERRGLLAGGGF